MAHPIEVVPDHLQSPPTSPPAGEAMPDASGMGPWYDRSSIRYDAMVTIQDQTPDDFERLAPENAFCEYIDGVVYMPSPVSDRHQHLSGFFFHLLDGLACERPIGEVMQGPAVLRLGERRKLEPDLFVRPIGPAPPGTPPALLVIEILSRSTRHIDLGPKLNAYREAGIPEIWLVDDLGKDRCIIVERKDAEGYRREVFTQGRLASTAIRGFWVEVAWLWQSPLPSRRDCLAAILADDAPAGPG